MAELELPYDAFLRAVKQSTDIDHIFLLGAGASISSNVQSAADCIWEWKRDIFISKNLNLSNQYKEYKSTSVQESVQKWLDNEGNYLPKNDIDEYSAYAELAYPIEEIRRKYFENLCRDKEPYIGYKILCLLAKAGLVKAVFTTNFDGLAVKASHQLGITPIEITLDSSERIYRPSSRNELLCISLHGDYKYGPLKNTNQELDSQHADFVRALVHHLNDKHLIVCGYSGRDKSLMAALKEAYQNKGSGILYWCGYGAEINNDVRDLLDTIRAANRQAYYISTDGFDNTLIHLAKSCYSENLDFQQLLATTLTANTKQDWVKTPFTMDVKHTNAIIRSNLFPFVAPKEIFQFEFIYSKEEKLWELVKRLTSGSKVVAGPIKNMIYAFGTLTEVRDIFKGRINGDIQRTPISNDDFRDGSTMKSLILQTILRGICSMFQLKNDGFDKIWHPTDKTTITAANVKYEIYEAVKLSLFFDKNSKFAYLSLKPSFWIEDYQTIPKAIKLEIGRSHSEKLLMPKPNFNFNLFLEKWKAVFFQNGKLSFEYPIDSASGFRFTISPDSMHVKIMRAQSTYGMVMPQNVDQRIFLHTGIQYNEPKLQFASKNDDSIVYDFHPMRGLIQNRPYDYSLNGNVFEASINIAVICPPEFGYKVADFLNRLHQPQSAGNHNSAYLIDYPGFSQAYGIPLNVPDFKSGLWERCILSADTNADSMQKGLEILRSIKAKIDILEQTSRKSIIVIFIPDAWSAYTKVESEQEKFDLHSHIKAYAAQKGIATQFLREDTLTDGLKCQVNWWLSLSLYVKALRTPWILSGLDSTTAFVGIGYSINHRSKSEKIVLGCSHIYSSSGQGLKYKLSRVEDCVYDRKNNPYLSYQDSYKFGVSIREMFLGSMGELPKRVVVHKRTPFRKDEIKGIVDSLKKSGISEVDLIEINYEDDARFLALTLRNDEVQVHSYPLSRGSCFLLDSQTALLWTHGIVPSVKGTGNYFLGGKNVPIPLKIKKHYGSSNISTIATEILGLTKVNWNSFDLYSKLPATIQTSNEIAKIGWLLNRFEGRTYDYRNFM